MSTQRKLIIYRTRRFKALGFNVTLFNTASFFLAAPCSLWDLSSLVVCVLVAQSCLTLWDPIDCSPPGSSVHGILQARILKWVAIFFSRGSSQPRDQTHVSHTAGRFFTDSAAIKPGPQQWKHPVLTTRPPENSPDAFLNANLLSGSLK